MSRPLALLCNRCPYGFPWLCNGVLHCPTISYGVLTIPCGYKQLGRETTGCNVNAVSTDQKKTDVVIAISVMNSVTSIVIVSVITVVMCCVTIVISIVIITDVIDSIVTSVTIISKATKEASFEYDRASNFPEKLLIANFNHKTWVESEEADDLEHLYLQIDEKLKLGGRGESCPKQLK